MQATPDSMYIVGANHPGWLLHEQVRYFDIMCVCCRNKYRSSVDRRQKWSNFVKCFVCALPAHVHLSFCNCSVFSNFSVWHLNCKHVCEVANWLLVFLFKLRMSYMYNVGPRLSWMSWFNSGVRLTTWHCISTRGWPFVLVCKQTPIWYLV